MGFSNAREVSTDGDLTPVLRSEALRILSRFLYSLLVSRSFIKKQDLEMKKFSLCHCHSPDVLAHMQEEVFIPGVTQLLLANGSSGLYWDSKIHLIAGKR